MTKKYRSDVMESIHQTAVDLHSIGLVNKKTMHEFNELCLTKIEPLVANEIKNIRLKENVSQVVFAHYLNVSTGIISEWERGSKKPSGSALKLLSLVKKNGLKAIS